MKFLIFTEGNVGKALAEGIVNLGHEVDFLHGGVWDDDYYKPCDIGLVLGFRRTQKEIIACYERRGTPMIVIDLGFVHRWCQDEIGADDTYMQLGFHGALNWLPKTAPVDRLEKLNIAYKPQQNVKSDAFLIAGQWEADANNRFETRRDIKIWANEMEELVFQAGFKSIYRHHPRVARDEEINQEFLEADMAQVRGVITSTSNIGHDALIAGLPVFCDGGAMYRELANDISESSFRSPKYPSRSEWEAYFARVAYAQWSFNEMKTGEPIKYYLESVLPNLGMDFDIDDDDDSLDEPDTLQLAPKTVERPVSVATPQAPPPSPKTELTPTPLNRVSEVLNEDSLEAPTNDNPFLNPAEVDVSEDLLQSAPQDKPTPVNKPNRNKRRRR